MYVCMYVCVYTELSYLSNVAQELLSPMRSYELMQNMIDEDLSLLWMSGTYIHTYIHTVHTHSSLKDACIHTYIQVPTVDQNR